VLRFFFAYSSKSAVFGYAGCDKNLLANLFRVVNYLIFRCFDTPLWRNCTQRETALRRSGKGSTKSSV